MLHIGFLTSSGVPDFTPSDKLLADYLALQGIHASPLIWNEPDIAWERYDLLVVRSVWDYHLSYDEWMSFLDKLEKSGIPVANNPQVLRWNSNKRYLAKIHPDYSPVPFKIFEKGRGVDLAKLIQEEGWEKVVVKPTVSASAYQTWTCTKEDAMLKQDTLDALLKEREIIIQEFAPEVLNQGEWSLVFFDKKHCHSVLKRAKEGEFRVQSDFGGTAEVLEAPKAAIKAAQAILNRVKHTIQYARVDGIMRGDRFHLMELELIEPELFVADHPGSEKLFGDALLKMLS